MKNYGLLVFGLGLLFLAIAKFEILSVLLSVLHVFLGMDFGLNFRNSFAIDVLLTTISMILLLAGSFMIKNEYK